MLVDDHTMVRRGLATFLKVYDDLELVGEAADGEAAVQLCARLLPDVILMDMVMPNMDGVTATGIIQQRFPTVRVIALTSFKEEKLVQDALQAGAIGYLLKDISAEKLAQAIRDAHAGHSTLSPEAAHALIQATTQRPPLGHDLTEREQTVLVWMVTGLNNSEIAEKLGVSPSTIKSHVSHILSKLDVTSRTEAVAWLCVTTWLNKRPFAPPLLPQLAELHLPRLADANRAGSL
ncbi:MAG: response regulator transcription factor [Chloroflexi bacterium]|nr:response regulator transcription factor [Chloroflexota bacterium]